MADAAAGPRPTTVAEAFTNTARALEQFSIERIRVEGLSCGRRSGSRGPEREAEEDEGVRTLTEQAFMREFVFQSRPCVIVGALEDWPAMQRWRDDTYLFDLDGHFESVRRGTEEVAALSNGTTAATAVVDSPLKDEEHDLSDDSTQPHADEEEDGLRRVTVALTPNGRADAVTYVTYQGTKTKEDGEEASTAEEAVVTEKLFMSAAEIRATLPELYQLLCANPAHPPARPVFVDLRRPAPVVAYAQMQNNCLEVEYQHLHDDIRVELDRFGERVFGGPHEAANVWFGTPASVSSMHQDWVENLYAVVRGVKEFILIPPWEGMFVPKPELPSAAFAVQREDEERGYSFAAAPVRDGLKLPWMDVEFTPAAVEDAVLLPPNLRGRLHPLVAYVQPGEVLYLPAMWLHRVAQHADVVDRRARENHPARGEEAAQNPPLPLIAAVNYWYEMNFTNPAVVMLREFGLLL
ncbi:transcription factor jumonji, jmjC domain-containing protein [Trypanosoma rangeli]|uniref:Transcription factor jumonji, jmjC domain-containing protein n=1 Tax=Trypanosoma rangeli TaxID=5698 RepID=A0A3R7K325_TRYRA|nr:transcription factor jumonji, jmjC domain-containing protein [Trypanosoma rangeli]RNF00870.1 transcription factor jumonji, jmjC domain-containing protein [Trypanosoma rangeli]|eukprot:RNF00870.1 transcription factor jumonji, jmjC domain-containing protein [Trypanosoma rangeli]